MRGFRCKVCGFISINGSAPERCPVCGAPKASFEDSQDAIMTPQDINDLSELEKKHIPAITVVKQCGLIPEGCYDLHAKIGQIQHPMQTDHYIQHIDFYIDNLFIARTHLTPDKLNPAAALHLKAGAGKLTVVEFCTLHGAWIAEEDL